MNRENITQRKIEYHRDITCYSVDMPPHKERMRNIYGLSDELDISVDEIEVSIKNLNQLDCISIRGSKEKGGIKATEYVEFTHFGREILRACSI